MGVMPSALNHCSMLDEAYERKNEQLLVPLFTFSLLHSSPSPFHLTSSRVCKAQQSLPLPPSPPFFSCILCVVGLDPGQHIPPILLLPESLLTPSCSSSPPSFLSSLLPFAPLIPSGKFSSIHLTSSLGSAKSGSRLPIITRTRERRAGMRSVAEREGRGRGEKRGRKEKRRKTSEAENKQK